jgi:hypothetical protein
VTTDEAISMAARKALEAVAAVEAQGLNFRKDTPLLELLGAVSNELEHVASHAMGDIEALKEGRAVAVTDAECATIALRKLAMLSILLWAVSPHSAAALSDAGNLN